MTIAKNHHQPIALDDLVQDLLDVPAVRRGYEHRAAVVATARMIKAERIKAGLTQKQLADLIGSTQPEIVRLEAGMGQRGPTTMMLKRVADACQTQSFMGFIDASPAAAMLDEHMRTVTQLARKAARSQDEVRAIEAVEGIHSISAL